MKMKMKASMLQRVMKMYLVFYLLAINTVSCNFTQASPGTCADQNKCNCKASCSNFSSQDLTITGNECYYKIENSLTECQNSCQNN